MNRTRAAHAIRINWTGPADDTHSAVTTRRYIFTTLPARADIRTTCTADTNTITATVDYDDHDTAAAAAVIFAAEFPHSNVRHIVRSQP